MTHHKMISKKILSVLKVNIAVYLFEDSYQFYRISLVVLAVY